MLFHAVIVYMTKFCKRLRAVIHLADEGSPNFGGRDGMTHGDVAIRAHDGQKYGAGELVDACSCHVRLAHNLSEGPRLATHRGQ